MSDEESFETLESVRPEGRVVSSSQNKCYLGNESDPLEYEGGPLDESTNRDNDDTPTTVLDEAFKVTLTKVIESSGLEILESVQPTGKSAS